MEGGRSSEGGWARRREHVCIFFLSLPNINTRRERGKQCEAIIERGTKKERYHVLWRWNLMRVRERVADELCLPSSKPRQLRCRRWCVVNWPLVHLPGPVGPGQHTKSISMSVFSSLEKKGLTHCSGQFHILTWYYSSTFKILPSRDARLY